MNLEAGRRNLFQTGLLFADAEFIRWLLTGWLLLLAACRAGPAPSPPATSTPPVALRIGLASSATAVPDLVSTAYSESSGQLPPQFITANSATLWADLAAGELDALLVHHLSADNERWFNPVAVDGLVVVTHPDNPVTDLTLGEVQALFNGRLTNWSALGGPDLPVVVIGRERGAGVRTLLRQRVLAEQPLDINARIETGDAALLAAVAAEPGAVGVSMMGTAVGSDVTLVTIEGIVPTPNSVGSQSYPLTQPLYFVHGETAEPEGTLRLFLAWLQSPAGQNVLSRRYGRVR